MPGHGYSLVWFKLRFRATLLLYSVGLAVGASPD